MAKTLRSRIAAVAVAALGMGVLSTAPVSAASASPTTATTMTITSPTTTNAGLTTVPIPQGTAITADLTLTTGTNEMDATEYITVTYTVTDPLGTDITSGVTFTAATSNVGTNGVVSKPSASAIKVTATDGTVAAAGYTIGTMTIPAAKVTVGGVYTVVTVTSGDAGTKTEMDGSTSLARGKIFVSGSGVFQGTSRAVDGTAVTSGAATVKFYTPTHASGVVYRAVSSGAGAISGASGDGTVTSISGVATDFSSGVKMTTTSANQQLLTLQLSSSAAGAQTVKFYSEDATTGVTTLVATSVVTWQAAQAVTLGNSTAYISATTSSDPSVDDTYAVYGAATLNTQAATIKVTVKDQYNNAFDGRTVTASISGAGLVSAATTRTGYDLAARAGAVSSGALSGNTVYINVWGSGVSGVGTVTIKDYTSGLVLGTKTVNFYGTVAKVTVSTIRMSVVANGDTTTAPFTVKAYDSNDVLVNGVSLSASPANDISIITGWTCSARGASAYPGQYRCYATGFVPFKYGEVSVVFQDSQAVPVKSEPAKITVGKGKISSLALAFDKASYAPGELMTLTITAKDDAGNPVADRTAAGAKWTGLYTMESNFATTTVLADTTDGAFGALSLEAKGGTQTVTMYAPTVSGTFTVTAYIDLAAGNYLGGVLAASLYGAELTASAKINPTNAEVAADAAKAEAAKATAAVAALTTTITGIQTAISTLVASVTASLTAMSASIAKIMKKLKIK